MNLSQYWLNEAAKIVSSRRSNSFIPHNMQSSNIKHINHYIKRNPNAIIVRSSIHDTASRISINKATTSLLYLQLWSFSIITHAYEECHPTNELLKYADECGFTIASTLLPENVIIYECDPNQELANRNDKSKYALYTMGLSFTESSM